MQWQRQDDQSPLQSPVSQTGTQRCCQWVSSKDGWTSLSCSRRDNWGSLSVRDRSGQLRLVHMGWQGCTLPLDEDIALLFLNPLKSRLTDSSEGRGLHNINRLWIDLPGLTEHCDVSTGRAWVRDCNVFWTDWRHDESTGTSGCWTGWEALVWIPLPWTDRTWSSESWAVPEPRSSQSADQSRHSKDSKSISGSQTFPSQWLQTLHFSSPGKRTSRSITATINPLRRACSADKLIWFSAFPVSSGRPYFRPCTPPVTEALQWTGKEKKAASMDHLHLFHQCHSIQHLPHPVLQEAVPAVVQLQRGKPSVVPSLCHTVLGLSTAVTTCCDSIGGGHSRHDGSWCSSRRHCSVWRRSTIYQPQSLYSGLSDESCSSANSSNTGVSQFKKRLTQFWALTAPSNVVPFQEKNSFFENVWKLQWDALDSSQWQAPLPN